ncbi:DUF748 domain-containing protein [Tamlana fucoidanivorans]|uniref:DUF748 domain-containing protein n=1 Tax=Allotamlana fucoidanivorans TaxID=2583814 RepID=A0A5C4SQC9_9FLAO|nr:DUF748 domain-containing protein [Tamlana fucoidanivorans]TNJ46136.1 DUF748 domain-containing protein [Tamlana fucoidanivorans]
MRKKSKLILGIILALIILVLIALPYVIKNYAINHSKTLLGRQIDIGKLRYNYFSSTLQIYDFKMLEQNESDEFTSFDTLIVNLEPFKLLSNNKVIEQFYVKGLMVNIIMKDSTFNFDDLISFHSMPEDTLNASKESFKYAISNIELKDVDFIFNDHNVKNELYIKDFSFNIPHISWNQEEKSNADFKFNFDRGGYFESTLNINPITGDFDGSFTVHQLYLDNFLNYVKPYAHVNTFDGVVDSKINVHGNTKNAINSILSGTINVSDFKMTDFNNKEFLAANSIKSNIDKIDYANQEYVLNRIDISHLYTYFQLDSISNNFFKIFKIDKVVEAENPADTSNTENLLYTIKNLSVNNSVLDYTDNLTGAPFKYHLSNIDIDSKDIKSTANWLDINATMLLNNRGNLKAKLGINPQNYLNSTLNISIEKFLLPDLNLYTNYYMGHSILQGDMYYYSQSKIVDGTITSENKMLVKNASLENVKGGLYDLPLKFAFYLLTDKHGDVNLEIPVRGNLNDPNYNMRKIIWQTFKNVIGKTVAAPVNFLVNLVGGDPKELEEIELTYTDTIPSNKNFRQLDKLIALENKKPELQISLTYYVDKALQKQALGQNLAEATYRLKTGDVDIKDEKKFEAFIFKEIDTDSLPLDKAIIQFSTQKNLDSFAEVRDNLIIKTTQDYLKEQSFSSKITIKKSTIDDPENTGAYPKFLITYGMKGETNTKDH